MTAVGRIIRTRTKVAAIVVTAAVGLTLTAGVSPASAATNQWHRYQTDYDRCYDIAVYFDAYGRPERAWLDVNNNCTWDTLARNWNGSTYGEVWFDVAEGGPWEALLVNGSLLYTNSGGSQYSSVTDPWYGMTWRRVVFTNATVGSPTWDGLSRVILDLARQTGYWVP